MNSLYDTFHLGNILGLPCSPSAPDDTRDTGKRNGSPRSTDTHAPLN
jgi:hypothetical protein